MPSMKVEGDSDGDGDMSGGETERSNGSSRGPDRDSSAEEADEPDSDDSSEMDESECERRRNECLDNLANLERQFTVLREQLYCERVKQVDHQLAEVRGGRSQEYLGPLRRLQENMRIRIEVAGILKTMRYENIKHKYEAEELAAQQHFKIRMQFARKYDLEGEEQPAQSDNQEEEPNQTNEDHEVPVESPKPVTRDHDDTMQTHNITLNSVSYNPPPETPVIQSAASRSLVNDECQMFANYLACKLRSYTKKTRNTAQYQINHILYLADDGQFEAPTGGMTTQNVQIVNLPRRVVAAPFAHLANNSSILVNSSNITNGDDVCEIDIKEEN